MNEAPKIKAILIDDESSSLRSLTYELSTYCSNVDVMETFQDPIKALPAVRDLKPDVIFLDIEMPKMNGFEFLQSFDVLNFDVVFVTAYDEFAIKAFEFNAVDYLLKPVLKSKLIQCVQKLSEKKEREFKKEHLNALLQNVDLGRTSERGVLESIAIPTQEGFELIPIQDITFLSAESNYTWMHLVDGKKMLISKTLKDVAGMIHRPSFFRTHKSYFVNLNQVKKYVRGRGGFLVMRQGGQIPVSRTQRGALMERFEVD